LQGESSSLDPALPSAILRRESIVSSENLLGGGDEEARLRVVTEDLKRRFGRDPYRISVVTVEQEVSEAVRRYDDARIRDFVPILAEKDARTRLRLAARAG
jgi:hypothetical protein